MAAEESLLSLLKEREQQRPRSHDSHASAALRSDHASETLGFDHQSLVSAAKSLEASNAITLRQVDIHRAILTDSADDILQAGVAPEAECTRAVIAHREPMAMTHASSLTGFKQAMTDKLLQPVINHDKSKCVTAAVGEDALKVHEDSLLRALSNVKQTEDGDSCSPLSHQYMKRRKLLKESKKALFEMVPGPNFERGLSKPQAALTSEMIASGSWQLHSFKQYNLTAGAGADPGGGRLHPLLRVRDEVRRIFIEMGFQEMDTSRFVESAFWNFDALVQPQQHPARDAHDTFYLSRPSAMQHAPEDYVDCVRSMHQRGSKTVGSTGYKYPWRRAEANQTLLRTHTTATSARMLHRLAQEGFRPVRWFSIDRVFRNEAVDRTHLAEFHQVEGVVAGFNLSLAHLIGTLSSFFMRLGMGELQFKPAYNPYTEPSAEIFAYHQQLCKWVEVGNSGIFRPEMLEPLGLPANASVIAWGLSLERPTMILQNINNIRELFGTRVDLASLRSSPICRLGFRTDDTER